MTANASAREEIALRARNDDMDMTWCFRRADNRCMSHFHFCVELVYVERGMMMGLIDGQEVCIQAGQMLVVSSYSIHSFTTPESSLVIVAVIPMEFVPTINKRLRNQRFGCGLIEKPPEHLVQLMRLLLASGQHGSRETIQGLSQAILGLLIDRYGTHSASPSASSGVIRQAIAYMQEHYTEPITVQDLSRQLSYSASRLSHLFSERLHVTFLDYLGTLRCRHAAAMLRSGVADVQEVAQASGFRSVSTFYRVFRRTYGLPPLEYARVKQADG